MSDFHFLRPLWLLLLLLLPVLPLVFRHGLRQDSGWSRVIPQRLLAPLLTTGNNAAGTERAGWVLPVLLILVAAVTLAGPSWREAPTPLQQQNDSLVIVLDLSASMLATDVKPNRLTVAKRKIRDILTARPTSMTALVVYAGDGHVVTPLTDDRRTIEGMLDALDPLMMPAAGNRADLAIAQALPLLDKGALGQGRIVLIADDISEVYAKRVERQLTKSPYTLSTLVVGTTEGGPIPLPGHGFIRDNDQIVMAPANPEALAAVARASGGSSHTLTLDNSDIRALRLRSGDTDDWQATERNLAIARWQDDGYWLLWLLLPLALFSWRRGSLLLLLMVLLPALPRPAMALDWADLWARPEQRGSDLIEQDPERAASRLEDPEWKGSALYRAGKYNAAAEQFSQKSSADADYNRGNALAQAGKLKEARGAYQQALEKDPQHDDARVNDELIKSLLEQQQNEQNQQNNQQQGDNNKDDQNSQNNQDGDKEESQQSQSPDSSQPDTDSQDGSPSDTLEPDIEPGPETRPDTATAEQQLPEQPAELNPSALNQEQEQWLRRIPDNPGGLLQRKFLQQYQHRETQPDKSDTPW